MYATPELGVFYAFGIDILIILIFVGLTFYTLVEYYNRKKSLKGFDFYSPVLISLAYFILFKHTVVRSHIDEFHKISAALIGILIFNFSGNKIGKKYLLVGYLAVLGINTVYYHTTHVFYFKSNPMWEDISIAKKIDGVLHYRAEYRKGKKIDISTACVFPNSDALNLIGKSSVDIMPFEITVMELNKLNYDPRPVMQSYQVTDGKLDKLNMEKYLGEKAPNFVMFNMFGLDGKNILHEETFTKIALMSAFSYTGINFPDAYGSISLFQKKAKKEEFDISTLSRSHFLFSDSIIIPPSDNLLLLKVNLKYSTLGFIKRTLFVPSELNIKMYLEDNSMKSFRCILPVAKEGIIINKYVDYYGQGPERDNLIIRKGEFNKKVKSIKFFSNEPWGFEPEFDAEFLEVKFSGVKVPLPSYPKLDRSSVFNSNTSRVSGQFELMDTTKNYVSLKGWAYNGESKNCCNEINLLVDNGFEIYKVKSYVTARYDVVQNQKLSMELANIGFSGLILKPALPKGKYKVLLQAIDNSAQKAIAETGIAFIVQ